MNVWFISDTHFSHENSLKFTSSDGGRMRREFSTVEEMDEAMIQRWNSVVGQYDKVYHLGDVGFNRNNLESILKRLNGKKRLILGNHDKFEMQFYARHFDKIMESWNPVRSLVVTHRPTLMGTDHPKIKANLHGHIHRAAIDDDRYLNISVEMINYTPIHWDDIILFYRRKGITIE